MKCNTHGLLRQTETPGRYQAEVILELSTPRDKAFRYYCPEGTNDLIHLWTSECNMKNQEQQDNMRNPTEIFMQQDLVMELIPRSDGSAIPVQLFINDIPYQEAIELLSKHQLPIRSQPKQESPL